MKTIKMVLTLTLAAWALGVQAQERDVSIRVVNHRERPVSRIAVESVAGEEIGLTDRNGIYVFKNMAADDQIRILLSPTRQAIVPTAGMDSLVVTIRRRNRYDYSSILESGQVNIGYGTVSRRSNTMSVSELDVEKIVRQTSSATLIDAVRGRIAGMNIAPDGSTLIRGQRSLNYSNEPLVVVDGMVWNSTFQEASDQLNVNDVKTVSVLKDGSMYGSRGANGVILITLK